MFLRKPPNENLLYLSGYEIFFGQDWEIVMYYDGKKFPGIFGGQDAWLLKKLR